MCVRARARPSTPFKLKEVLQSHLLYNFLLKTNWNRCSIMLRVKWRLIITPMLFLKLATSITVYIWGVIYDYLVFTVQFYLKNIYRFYWDMWKIDKGHHTTFDPTNFVYRTCITIILNNTVILVLFFCTPIICHQHAK